MCEDQKVIDISSGEDAGALQQTLEEQEMAQALAYLVSGEGS